MKRFNTLTLSIFAISIGISSCAKMEDLAFQVDKPASYLDQEGINQYAPLKNYIDRTKDPDFKLGSGAGLQDYVSKGVMYRLLNSNFNEITMGWEMKHMAVVNAEGDLMLDNIAKLLETSRSAGMSIFGHTLCWHANQNAKYLNRLITPPVTPGSEPGWKELMDNSDVEGDDFSHFHTTKTLNGENITLTPAGQGAGGSGRAIVVSTPKVMEFDWQNQFFISFSPAVKEGETYEFSFSLRADDNAGITTQAHKEPGQYIHWDMLGYINATTTWTTYTKKITITKEQASAGAIAFNLGATATNYYFDNISFRKEVVGTEYTPEEKFDLIYGALEKWIGEMVTYCKDDVHAWDVVNEPMSDWPDVYKLKTGVGRTDLAEDEFFWQDYLGYDYAVYAFKLARQYGNPNDIHFINDYGLEYNLDKCKGLIQYVKHVESKGARIDGIGTQMHIDININKDNIIKMYQLLAATGKLIKVSELDIGLGDNTQTSNATPAQYAAQADMYKFVIEKYFEIIPAKQRYGITLWSPTDSPDNSSWRAGEPIGIWNIGLTRKPAYKGVAEALEHK